MPVFHTKVIEGILEPVAQQVDLLILPSCFVPYTRVTQSAWANLCPPVRAEVYGQCVMALFVACGEDSP